MTRFTLFGSLHMNARGAVTEDFRGFAGDADAIAVEFPRPDSPRALLGLAIRFPLVLVGMNLLGLLIQMPLMVLLGRDVISTEKSVLFAEIEDRPIHPVDEHPIELLRDRSPLWIVGNWVSLLGLGLVAPIGTAALVGLGFLATVLVTLRFRTGRRWLSIGLFVPVFVGAVWLIFAGPLHWWLVLLTVAVSVAMIVRTVNDRDDIMLADCAEIVAEHDYDELCLVTGRGHISGMRQLAPEYDLDLTAVFRQRFLRHGETLLSAEDSDDELRDVENDAEPLEVTFDAERTEGVLVRRVGAALVDLLVLAVAYAATFFVLAAMLAFSVFAAGEESIEDSMLLEAFGLVQLTAWIVLIPVMYFGLQEHLYGRTLGHRATGLEVVSVDGSTVTWEQAIGRTASRLVDFMPVGYLLGMLVASRNDGTRRFGDLQVGTAVLRDSSD